MTGRINLGRYLKSVDLEYVHRMEYVHIYILINMYVICIGATYQLLVIKKEKIQSEYQKSFNLKYVPEEFPSQVRACLYAHTYAYIQHTYIHAYMLIHMHTYNIHTYIASTYRLLLVQKEEEKNQSG